MYRVLSRKYEVVLAPKMILFIPDMFRSQINQLSMFFNSGERRPGVLVAAAQ